MKTVYLDAISHTGGTNIGPGCRTLLRVPHKYTCKSNLRVVGIAFQVRSNPDNTPVKDQLKWANRGGFISCISEIRLRSSNGEEIDSVRYVPQLFDQVKGVIGSNSYHRDFLTVQTGSQVGYKLNEATGLLTPANNFDSALIDQQEYTLDLLNMFDYLRKVQFVETGLEVEILWENNPFMDLMGNTDYNLLIPKNPILALDEVLQEHVSIPKTVVFEQVWSDIVNIAAVSSLVAQVQNVQQRLKAVEGYYCTKLALCVYDQATNTPLKQLDEVVNFYNNGVLVVSLKGIEEINSATMLRDALGGVELNLPRVNYLTDYNSEQALATSQLQDTDTMGSTVTTVAISLNRRLNEFLLDYKRLCPGIADADAQKALNVYIFYWVAREATHEENGITTRYL